eukprot:3679222-Pyramimonas_sp.AAC.1
MCAALGKSHISKTTRPPSVKPVSLLSFRVIHGEEVSGENAQPAVKTGLGVGQGEIIRKKGEEEEEEEEEEKEWEWDWD